MVIYTPLAAEDVFTEGQARCFVEVAIGGARLLIESVGEDVRVARLISTDPEHYLLPGLQPGDRLCCEAWWRIAPLLTAVALQTPRARRLI